MVKKYKDFINEAIKTKHIDISDGMLDSMDLNKIVICFNDGQGDHDVYTYKDIVSLLENSEPSIKGLELKPSQIIERFYVDIELTGNNSDALYFDGEFKIINWIK